MPDDLPSFDRLKASMRSTWMAGDFGVIARNMANAAAEFARRLGVVPGMHALDVACGSGNVAIPLAQLGAVTTGVDIATNLLEQARQRALDEHLKIAFEEGDAEQLAYADGSFDLVATMFGAMFAPRPALVAAEFARVIKPGGRLAMANWTPAGFTGRMFNVSSAHVKPPEGIAPPVQWGDPEIVRERLGGGFTEIETEVVPIVFHLPMNAAGAVGFFRKYFGPTQVAFSRLDEAGQEALAADLEALWSSANVSEDPANEILVHNEYLQVIARRV